MIGLVIVTHGKLAEEFKSAMEHVVGPQENVRTISIGPDDNMEVRKQDILNAVKEVNSSSGVIILTDMFGGTPSNLAISLMEESAVEVIAGVNLPMLIKLASLRESESLAEVVAGAKDAGQKYISIASETLAGTE